MNARDTGDRRRNEYEDERTGVPRWVKISLVVAAIVALLVVVMILAGGGHSPRRHGASAPVAGSVPAPAMRPAAVR